MNDLMKLVNSPRIQASIELVGSQLAKEVMADSIYDNSVMLCFVSDVSDQDAMEQQFSTYIFCHYADQFISDLGIQHKFAVLIDTNGTALKMTNVGGGTWEL